MQDNKPNVNTAQFWFGIIADNCCAKVVSHPTLSNAPMLNKMPKKNKILGVSIFCKAVSTLTLCLSCSSFLPCKISVSIHRIPKPNNMPKKGGNCVTILKTGTNNNVQMPTVNTKICCALGKINSPSED